MPPRSRSSAELVYTWWERFLNSQSELLGGDREFTELSNKLNEVRTAMAADGEVTPSEMDLLMGKMEAVADLWGKLAARKGVRVDATTPATRESFRVFREESEIHFQTLAGDDSHHYRGGLLRQLLDSSDAERVSHQIVLDLLTSASTPIAVSKVHLLRAQLSLIEDTPRQGALLERVRHHLARELTRAVWTARGTSPAIQVDQFDQLCRFESIVAVRQVPLPGELRGTNRMLANRPVAGRDEANRTAVRALLAEMRSAGKLFLDGIEAGRTPVNVAVKIELNLGIEGPPSVTDPAVTYAVVAELLESAEARGVSLRLTVGDSNGIENAPVGCTSLDVMRETGNYHAVLKAALGFASRSTMPELVRTLARSSLERILALERHSPPVYFGSSEDRVSSQQDREAAEAAAAHWAVCVDYDEAGFRAVDSDAGPLGRAVWGSNQYHVAEPWVAADYRVHVTRGVSNHLFAGWTGALKGLVGLHALGGRPADRGMKQRGDSLVKVLSAVMGTGSFTGLFEARSGVRDFSSKASTCDDARCRSAFQQSVTSWNELSRFARGRAIWAEGAAAIEEELRREEAAGVPDIQLMAKMRRSTVELLAKAERAAPGFRSSLQRGVADGTRAFLLTMWRMRELIPAVMRDERMGLRIGVLTRLPHQADLVVQGLPKVGLGGGPDAYFDVRDVGIVIAGTDEISVDLTALRHAGIPGNPWAFNHPIHGALQFGGGPISWDQIREISGRG